MVMKGFTMQQLFIRNFLKQIKKNGSPHIVDDLKYVILTARVDDQGNFKIVRTTIVNSKKEREDVNSKPTKKEATNGKEK